MSPDRHADRLDVPGHTDRFNLVGHTDQLKRVAGHIYLLPFDAA